VTKYAYDPAFLALLPSLPTIADLGDPKVLAQMRGPRPEIFGTPPPDRDDVTKRDRTVPGRKGDPDVPIRIYTPRAPSRGARGCVVEIHGGGFIMGDVAMMDPWCQAVAALCDAVVVSVEYRLAPEHPFPAGIEDCHAALSWTAAHAGELGVDPARIAIAGQSAGGGLAAGTALLARDRGGPKLCFQLLEIPELDDRLETASMRAFTDTPLWNRPNAVWSWRYYLGESCGGDVSPYAAPARAKDLSNLPPAYVSTMEFDPLRDEGIDYALRMLQAGVQVELHSFPGTFHGSMVVTTAEVSQRSLGEALGALSRALRKPAA
jgi:acetyl esterase/lipase